MNRIPNTNEIPERLSRVETSIEGFHGELGEIRESLKSIQQYIGRSRETNWSVIFAGMAVAGSLYAAAIRPLAQDIMRQETRAVELARMLVTQNEMQFANKNELSKLTAEFREVQAGLLYIREHGSPITDKRLTLLENGIVLSK